MRFTTFVKFQGQSTNQAMKIWIRLMSAVTKLFMHSRCFVPFSVYGVFIIMLY